MAEKSKDRLTSVTRSKIVTEILPFTGFHLAEDYHQKHILRSYPVILEEFEKIYPVYEDLVSSTAVSRVNGYLGGNGTCDKLKAEIVSFGLSESAKHALLVNVCGGDIEMSCSRNKCS